MSAMGVKIDQFDVPVCNSFQAKILNDQLCYEVDLNKFSIINIERVRKVGFHFIMDYNEDRQVKFDIDNEVTEISLAKSMMESKDKDHAYIYLDTVGKNFGIL